MGKKRSPWSKDNEGGKISKSLEYWLSIMPQGIRTGGIQSPVQFVILGKTYEELINWKNIIKGS